MGGIANFKQPPAGPKIGPVVDYADLPTDQQEAIGDLSKVQLPTAEPVDEKVKEGAQALDALNTVLEREQQEDVVDTLYTDAIPTTEDKQEFLRALLGNRLYTKEYELYSGLLNVTMRDSEVQQEERLFAHLAKLDADETYAAEDSDTLQTRYRLLVNIGKVSIAGKALKIPPIDEPDAAIKTFIGQLPSTAVYRALMRVVRVFVIHLSMLLEKAIDKDFWQADGHV